MCVCVCVCVCVCRCINEVCDKTKKGEAVQPPTTSLAGHEVNRELTILNKHGTKEYAEKVNTEQEMNQHFLFSRK